MSKEKRVVSRTRFEIKLDTCHPKALDKFDRGVAERIEKRLNSGDLWAWCCVKVVAKSTIPHLEGSSSWLENCSYRDESDFKRSDYFRALKREALEDLDLKHIELAEVIFEED